VSGKHTRQIIGEGMSITEDEMEYEFYDWEAKLGKEDAILTCAEEWGMSRHTVERLIKKWENRLWQ
jgi:hypothetical protein